MKAQKAYIEALKFFLRHRCEDTAMTQNIISPALLDSHRNLVRSI